MINKEEGLTAEQIVDAVVEGIQEKKGVNISILDLTAIDNTITSYFVVCDGDSNVHVNAIGESVVEYLRDNFKEKPFHVEGRENAEWILIDYLDVVVHVFQRPVREFYSLETLWADAQRKDIENLF